MLKESNAENQVTNPNLNSLSLANRMKGMGQAKFGFGDENANSSHLGSSDPNFNPNANQLTNRGAKFGDDGFYND